MSDGFTGEAHVERLPLAVVSAGLQLAAVALLIPLFWLWVGALGGVLTAVMLTLLFLLFLPRALVLDENGFRLVSLVPRRTVPWSAVDAFEVGAALRSGVFVVYTKTGRRPRWWYPAGWPAQGGLPAVFAARPGERALSATELSRLLNDRLARERGRAPSPSTATTPEGDLFRRS